MLGCKNKIEVIDRDSVIQIDNFFEKLRSKNYEVGLNDLLASNKNIDLTDSSTRRLKSQFKDINELSGDYIGHDLLQKRMIKNDLAIYSYFVKYKVKFYRFIFIFYNPDGQVKLFKFAYDDAIDVELEESLKLYVQ
jgi:hypothetical protein